MSTISHIQKEMQANAQPASQPSPDNAIYGLNIPSSPSAASLPSSLNLSQEDDEENVASFRDHASSSQPTPIPPFSSSQTLDSPLLTPRSTPEINTIGEPPNTTLSTSFFPLPISHSSNHSTPDSTQSITEFESCYSQSFIAESAGRSSLSDELITTTTSHSLPFNPSTISPSRSSSPQLHHLSYLQASSSVSTSPQSTTPHLPAQRLSTLRHGGTAHVLDLASLVRSTRERAHVSQHLIPSPDSPDPASTHLTSPSPTHSIAIFNSEDSSENIIPICLAQATHSSVSSVPAQLNHALASHVDLDSDPTLSPLETAKLSLKLTAASSIASLGADSPGESASLRSDLMRDTLAAIRAAALSEMRQAPLAPDASAGLKGFDLENELEKKALSSCLPRVLDPTRVASDSVRSLVNSKRLKSRSKSQSSSLHHSEGRSVGTTDPLSLPGPTTNPASVSAKSRVRGLSFHGSSPINAAPAPFKSNSYESHPSDNHSNMHRKSGFFRRKMGSSQLDLNQDISVNSADLVVSQGPEGRLQHEPHCLKDTTPPVPSIPPSYQETDAPSLQASSYSTFNLHSKSQLARAPSVCISSGNPQLDNVPTLLHPTSHQEAYLHTMSLNSDQSASNSYFESFLQSTLLRSKGSTIGSSNSGTCEKSPMSSPPCQLIPQATSRATVSNGERFDPLSPRAPHEPHHSSASHLTHSRSTTRTGLEPLNLQPNKSYNKASYNTSPLTFLSSHSSFTTGSDQPASTPGTSYSPCGLNIPSLFPESTSSHGRISNTCTGELSEEDKLRLSLETWKLDRDGVLQDHVNPNSDRAFLKPTPFSNYNNLAENPPSDDSAVTLSPRLPSLVNPKRTAMPFRSAGEPSNKMSTLPARIKSPDIADHSTPTLSSDSPSSPDKISTECISSPELNLDLITSPNLSISTAVESSQTHVSRASSMKESRDYSSDGGMSNRVKLRRRGYTQNNDSLISNLLENQSPVECRQVRSDTVKSAQPSIQTVKASHFTLLKDSPPADNDNQSRHPSPSLSPSIRLVSSPTDTIVSEQDTSNSATCTHNLHNLSASSSPKLNRFTPSPPTSQKVISDLADSIASSQPSDINSQTLKADRGRIVPTGHVKRSGGDRLPKQSTHPNNISSAPPQIPQLHRRHPEQTPKHHLKTEERRPPRNHQSSPNLRSLFPPPLPDSSFFSVLISKHIQQSENCSLASPNDPESLNVTSGSASRQSSVSSVQSNPSLINPGMTLEANALRLAEMFWKEDETVIKRQKLTEWLGSPESNENQLQVLTRRAFLNKFDFKDLRIDFAFRKLCGKIYLKGETQQVDRILAEFSRRYWEQNQSTVYVNPDMVHALSYSILLLNTDLHVVDTVSRMSRSQFVRNTMETIGAQISHLEFLGSNRPASSKESTRPSSDMAEAVRSSFKSSVGGSIVYRPRRTSNVEIARTPLSPLNSTLSPARPSMERWREALWSGSQPPSQSSLQRQSFTSCQSEDDIQTGESLNLPPSETSASAAMIDHPSSLDAILSSPTASERPEEVARLSFFSLNDEHPSVIKPDKLSKAQFEKEVETLLKEIYTAIKTQPIAQITAESYRNNNGNYGSLQRITSRRGPNSHTTSARPNSPAPSANASISSGMMGYSSNGGSSLNLTNLTTPSVGFASNLSQSIIREQNEDESLESNEKIVDHKCDSALALMGAPWAKEGILQRKQYWESKGKRHKDRSWAEVFVVIQTGTLQMFQFGQNVGSRRAGALESSKSNSESSEKMAVGGGNWLPNAQIVGEISLSHALTSILVSGYSKERSYVFVLTLSNGASYFFQTGTEELVHEWVSTCNYWAARLSKEPLTGGVSNMEYGWNQLLEIDLNTSFEKKEDLQDCQQDQEEMMSIGSGHSEPSQRARSRLRDRLFNGLPLGAAISANQVAHSTRVGDLHNWSTSGSSINTPSISSPVGSKTSSRINLDRPNLGLPNVTDKVLISEWNPPVPPITLSTLPEAAQYENLKRHNSHIQMELEKHNLLRKPMINLYWNRPSLLQKAMTNWEKKAQYLMAEIIKYTTYLNALELTMKVRQNLKLA